jgi:hypothetical protein
MVLVINDGEIIERGTHEELLAKKGFYYRVYMSQFKGTNGGDLEPIRLIPAEQSAPQFTQRGVPGMGGMRRMGGMGNMGGMHGRDSTGGPRDTSNTSSSGHQGGMSGGSGMPEMRQRMMEAVKKFTKKGATSPDTALSIEELELPPMFEMMLKGPMGQMGPLQEHDGKYYVSKERLERMRERFGDS